MIHGHKLQTYLRTTAGSVPDRSNEVSHDLFAGGVSSLRFVKNATCVRCSQVSGGNSERNTMRCACTAYLVAGNNHHFIRTISQFRSLGRAPLVTLLPQWQKLGRLLVLCWAGPEHPGRLPARSWPLSGDGRQLGSAGPLASPYSLSLSLQQVVKLLTWCSRPHETKEEAASFLKSWVQKWHNVTFPCLAKPQVQRRGQRPHLPKGACHRMCTLPRPPLPAPAWSRSTHRLGEQVPVQDGDVGRS